MAEMSMYCKAVLADDLRKFPGFVARIPPSRAPVQDEPETEETETPAQDLSVDNPAVEEGLDEEIVAEDVTMDDEGAQANGAETDAFQGETVEYYFVHDDYIVTAGVYRDEQIAFDAVTDEWKQFCIDVLGVRPDEMDMDDEVDPATSSVVPDPVTADQ